MSCWPTTVEDRGKKIIIKEVGYPKRLSIRIDESKEADLIEAKLKSDGCIDTSKRKWVIPGISASFPATQKCAPFFESLTYTYYSDATKAGEIYLIVFEEYLADVTEVLSDSKQGIAEVKYSTVTKPYGIYYEFACQSLGQCKRLGIQINPNEIRTNNITLRKYDQGWKILR